MVNLQAIGQLGKDSEIKTLQDGKKMIVFSIGITQGYGDNKSTLWIECSKFGEKTTVADFLKKGTKVFISGEPTLRKWESNGKSGTTLQLRVNEIELLGSKPKETTTEGATPPSSHDPLDADDLPF
jgi:single-strand DNA-binding protein